MKKDKAVVFDMDGVLFDTERICLKVWPEVTEEIGLSDGYEVVTKCIGLNHNDTKIVLTDYYGKDFPYDLFWEKLVSRLRKIYEKEGVPMKKGVKELLVFLKEENYKIALASSSSRKTVETYLREAEITSFFQQIITGDMVEHSKPLPDIYLLACNQLDVLPEETFAIEDSSNGIRSAFAAGMKTILVPDVAKIEDDILSKCNHVFENLLQVMEYLKNQGV